MNILRNKTDSSQRKGLHAKVGSYIDGTGKLAMALLVAGALSGCSGNTFNSGLNDFGKGGGQLGEAGGKLLSSGSNLVNGNLGDSGSEFVQGVGNVGGAVVYGVSGATKVIVGTGKGIYEETIQSK